MNASFPPRWSPIPAPIDVQKQPSTCARRRPPARTPVVSLQAHPRSQYQRRCTTTTCRRYCLCCTRGLGSDGQIWPLLSAHSRPLPPPPNARPRGCTVRDCSQTFHSWFISGGVVASFSLAEVTYHFYLVSFLLLITSCLSQVKCSSCAPPCRDYSPSNAHHATATCATSGRSPVQPVPSSSPLPSDPAPEDVPAGGGLARRRRYTLVFSLAEPGHIPAASTLL